MEQEHKFNIHDTLNLDEIKQLLGDEASAAEETDEEPEVEVNPQPQEEAEPETEAEEVPAAEPEGDPTPEKEETPEKKKESFVYELYGMLHDVIYLLAAVTLIFVFVVRLVGVVGDSMLPTLHNNDFLLLESNFLYNDDDYEYGDIVVVNVPYYEEQNEGPIVKRIIATEGQTINIDFEAGTVYVDGVLLQETYVNAPTYNNWGGDLGLEYPAVVPEGCVFVLGDNRNNSMDSRYAPIGMIDERYVLGKVLLIALPGETKDQLGNVIDPRDWGRIGTVD